MRGKSAQLIPLFLTVLLAIGFATLPQGSLAPVATAREDGILDLQSFYTQRLGTPEDVTFIDANRGWGVLSHGSSLFVRNSLLLRTNVGIQLHTGDWWLPHCCVSSIQTSATP